MGRRNTDWELEEVECMPTEDIIRKLGSFGIHFDKEEFLRQTKHYLSSEELTDECYNNHSAVWFDEDFIWMAIMVLWKRLAPERINCEMINDEMQLGYDLLEQKKTKEAADLWLKTWDDINTLLPRSVKSVGKADSMLPMFQSIFNWSQTFAMEMHNAALEDKSYLEKGIRYCDEFCERFKDDFFQMQFALKKADFLYSLERKKELRIL